MKWSIRLGRFLGIEVFLHLTFVLFIAFIGVSRWNDDPRLSAVVTEVGFILSIFGCVLLHEYGHALMARRFGVGTRSITLLPIGGVAMLERMPEKPSEELLVAIAGPAVNVVIATVLYVILSVGGALAPLDERLFMGGAFLQRLMIVNLVLIVFNMLPAFPMDGGRVLRAFLAMRMDHASATAVAARIGQFVAVGFAIIGFYGNPMLIFIAFFVWIGAAGEANQSRVKSVLSGLPVSRAMMTDFHSLHAHDALHVAVDLVIQGSQHDFPVMEGGSLCGILSRTTLIKALADLGPKALVSEVMQRDFSTVEAAMPLEEALVQLNDIESEILPVMDRGKLVGLLTGENVGEFVLIQSAIKQPRG